MAPRAPTLFCKNPSLPHARVREVNPVSDNENESGVSAEKRPRNLTPWLCETTAEYVAFKHGQAPDQPRLFSWEQFLVQGRLPQPA